MPRVLHVVERFLPRSETFIYTIVNGHRAYEASGRWLARTWRKHQDVPVSRHVRANATADQVSVRHIGVPPRADIDGCNWPSVLNFEIGRDWRTGYYDIVLRNGAGETVRKRGKDIG